MKSSLLPDPTPFPSKVIQPAKRMHFPNLFGWCFAGFAAFVLVGIVLPVFNSVSVKGPQTKALAQAKQVGLALKLYAGDHNGKYPRAGVDPLMKTDPADANTAFAVLFPEYTQSETIFGNKLSAYQTVVPDNVIDTPYTGSPKETLQPGENVYGYVIGLTEGDDPSLPLVADGTDGTGHYQTDPAKRGGVWKGERAVVIRLDNSGTIEKLEGPATARFVPETASIPGHPTSRVNLLDFSRSGRDIRLLDPAVGPRRR